MRLPSITIYTDGACSPNPGPGGWGAVLLRPDRQPEELFGSDPESTNNRMELSAALYALAHLEGPYNVTLYTDSKYLKDGITSWIHNWKKRSWRTASRQPVKNRDLWEALDGELQRHTIKWKWVKGHAENEWNERADALAVCARQGIHAVKATSADVPQSGKASVGDDALSIYTAVTFRPSDKVGSWAVIFNYKGHYRVLGCRSDKATANRLHIEAAATALESLKRSLPVHLYTTSDYLKNGAEKWLGGWRKRQWKNRAGEAISNQDAWQRLAPLLEQYKVIFHLVDKKNDPPCLYQEAKELAREWAEDEHVMITSN